MHEGNWLNLIPQELQLSHFLLILWYKIFSIQWTKSGSVCYLLCKSPDKASCVYANIDKSSKVCLPGMTGRLHSSFVVFYFVFVLWRCCDVNRGTVFSFLLNSLRARYFIFLAQSENLGDLIQGSHILKIDSFLIRKEWNRFFYKCHILVLM